MSPDDAKRSGRQRIRQLFPSIVIGRYPVGPLNSLTDVPGVRVHTESIRRPNRPAEEGQRAQHAINTGFTTIVPRENWLQQGCPAAIFAFNGIGEMTGSHEIKECGALYSPIVITGSLNIGACMDGVHKWVIDKYRDADGMLSGDITLPVVAETLDSWLHDLASMPVTPEMVAASIDKATSSPVAEGNTGGGTGMICHQFKGGTGSASRVIQGSLVQPDGTKAAKTYTIGALVQANYGKKWDLHIGRVPVGKLLMDLEARKQYEANLEPQIEREKKDGSIIIVVATDAPLNPTQLERLARRATVGLARVGGHGSNGSGDIFLAFSTAHVVARDGAVTGSVEVNTDGKLDSLNDSFGITTLFEAAADAVEESIYNALCCAEDCVGPLGREVKALPLDEVKALLEKHYVC